MMNYNFEVNVIESGQRRKYGDSYYSYEIVSECSENDVKNFCINVLNKSYQPADMPNPFVGKFIEFKKLTNNNKDKGFFDNKVAETYSYKLSNEYTG